MVNHRQSGGKFQENALFALQKLKNVYNADSIYELPIAILAFYNHKF